jgi:hypothetical protein
VQNWGAHKIGEGGMSNDPRDFFKNIVKPSYDARSADPFPNWKAKVADRTSHRRQTACDRLPVSLCSGLLPTIASGKW